MPRADDRRRLDLLSNSARIPLTHETTTLYYNNNETDPIRRLGVATMENSHFSRAIALSMVRTERIRVAIYSAALVITWLYRATDLEIAATAAQVVFSEQVVSRWLRLEWLRSRCDGAYDALYSLFQTMPARPTLHIRVLEHFSYYETSKANAGITLSEKLFARLNDALSREWEEIKTTLGL